MLGVFLVLFTYFFLFFFFFFFNDTATTEIYTLSYTTLFRSVPSIPQIRSIRSRYGAVWNPAIARPRIRFKVDARVRDRKSTRLNSSHSQISYAVFCLKKKKQKQNKSILNIVYIPQYQNIVNL